MHRNSVPRFDYAGIVRITQRAHAEQQAERPTRGRATLDDTQAFMELSALLTGLYGPLLNDPEDHALNTPVAQEYARRLEAAFPQEFPVLLRAYKALASAHPRPLVDDALLAALRALQAFKDNEDVAKQIVKIWYISQFNDKSGSHVINGGFYERGNLWPIIKAHPLGFSTQLHGYWARAPGEQG